MEEIGMRTFAVLIDADMVPAEFATPGLAALGEWGQLAIKRAYADWGSPNRDSWIGELGRYAITPMPSKEHSPGRHSDDRALVIHALELHGAGIVDGVAIICGDDAFTPLAARLREAGAVVLGAGGTGVSSVFADVCDHYLDLGNLMSETNAHRTARARASMGLARSA